MSMLPEGYVDPTDPEAVAAVLAAVVGSGGLDAVTDLLVRLPHTRSTPPVPKAMFRAAVPAAVWVGSDYCWSCSDPPVLMHVSGGVELSHTEILPGDAPAALARVVAAHARRTAAVADISAVLTAARDLAGPGG